MKNPQPASPVISPRISTTAGIFSQVKTAVNDRLNHTVAGPNRIPQVMAAGRAGKPEASISNEMVAAIEAYKPQPGRQMARQMTLNVQNTPERRVDEIIDAIQRYLNIKPRREPTADPKDEASIARHPQQIIESPQRWSEAMNYRFTSNGVENYSFRPEYRAWAGGLELKLENEGLATIASPPTRSPHPGSRPGLGQVSLGDNVTYDPANAAQEAMSQILAATAEPIEQVNIGPQPLTQDAYFDPALAAQNAMAKMQADLAPARAEIVTVGPVNMNDNPANDPAQALQTSVNKAHHQSEQAAAASLYGNDNAYSRASHLMDDLNKPRFQAPDVPIVGRPPMRVDPEFSPVQSGRVAMETTIRELEEQPKQWLTVGPANFAQNPANNPLNALQTAVSRLQPYADQPGSVTWRGPAGDEPYLRAMRLMGDVNKRWFSSPVLDNKA